MVAHSDKIDSGRTLRLARSDVRLIEHPTSQGLKEALSGARRRFLMVPADPLATIAARDELLRRIASKYFGELPPTAQAKRISDELARYASRVWPRTRTAASCPHGPGLKADFWELLRLRDAPLSWRQVHRKLWLQCQHARA